MQFLRTCIIVLLCGSFCNLIHARNFFSPYPNSLEWSSLPVCLSHSGPKPVVKQYEMIEVGFTMPSIIEDLVENPKHGLNPFDPDDINVVAVFSNGYRHDTVYGFYYLDYVRDPFTIQAVNENCPQPLWTEQYTEYKWRVRYTPRDTGNWIVDINVHVKPTRAVTYVIDPLVFDVVHSSLPGFLAVGSDMQHLIETNKRKSFFIIGQDIAWTDGTRFRGGNNEKYPKLVSGGYLDVQDWISNLGRNGGNTVRVVNVPWSYEFEWDTVGVYSMQRAWELDTLFATCEKSNVKMLFCMEHGTYTLYPYYEELLTWTKHPYNRFIPGVDHPDDFFADSAARAQYKKKLRYFFARWGYSTSLGIFQILSEMDNWTFKDGKQLEDHKSLQQLNLDWHNEMLAFCKRQVAFRSLLTSTSYGDAPRDFSINTFSSPYIDVISPRHCYFTQRNDNLKRWGEVNRVSIAEPGMRELIRNKPVIIDEMGLGMLGGDPGDVDASTDVVFHNSIWATAFSGTAGSGLYWWSWSNNQYREDNFPSLNAFFRDVDFEALHYVKAGHWEDANRPSKVSIETFYVTSDDAQRSHCLGWVHNASYWWGNISQNVIDRNGKKMEINSRTGDDAKISAPTELPEGTKFEVHDLANGTVYALEWYNTRGAGGQSGYDEFRTNIFGNGKLPWRPHEADWGYKLVRLPGFSNSVTLAPDTITAGEVVEVFGNHPMEDGTFTYEWDFGNGLVSHTRNPEIIFEPGSYVVKLLCTDRYGTVYTMSQLICVTGVSLKTAFVNSGVAVN